MKRQTYLFFSVIFLFSFHLSARVGHLIPPETNPHPPKTEIEKEQVAFAEEALRHTLFKSFSTQNSLQKQNPILLGSHSIDFHNPQSLECLKNPVCLKEDTKSLAQLKEIQVQLGIASEIKFAHIPPTESLEKIPRLQQLKLEKNQRLVHAYLRFDQLWVHADVILENVSSGELTTSSHLYLKRIILTGLEKGPLGC